MPKYINKILPEDLKDLDTVDNQTLAFMEALKDILHECDRMMVSKNGYVIRRTDDVIKIHSPRFKVIST
tara:strand:- start:173 stop:379 length:207 start_codon:yes stop_codon:yes gene_type:complete